MITSHGVLALRPDHREVIALNWETGDEIGTSGSTARETWNSPRYLLASGSLVYGIGSEIRAFQDQSLKLPLWTFPRQAPAPDPKLAVPAQELELRGRVQLITGGLVVPTAAGIVVLDAETGEVTSTNKYDWLVNGIYFWENNQKRALEYPKFLQKNP